ncbi:MAG: SDR family NAD(P)-dependent oxidoreductase [bacterium]|nr:SDR family NAD(P)-dependent oxidoreductase [bacterium]
MSLVDRVYIVTGAAGGVGAGIAEALVNAGSSVALADLDLQTVEATALRVDPSGRHTLAVNCDVASDDSVREAVAATVARFGRLDGVVNNAGVIEMNEARHATSAAWARELDINATGVFRMCRAALEHLTASDRAAIVNVASNCGKVGFPNMAGYNASKAAVISLTRSLATEWAPLGINVNAVCPGAVDTPMLAGVADWLADHQGGDAEDILAGMALPQLGRKIAPIEVGRVVAFLLSPDALIIRGQAINVDAGETPY